MLISIDHGNYAIKTQTDAFIAGLTEYSVKPPLAEDIIEYEGSYWTLTGSRISYMRDKTKDERYFILTLFALAREILRRGEIAPYIEIDLAVGLPPEHYSTLRDKFSVYFKRSGVKFVYNGIPFCLSINRVLVYPQAYAAVIPQTGRLRVMQRLFIVDIGGYTTDVLLLRHGKPDLQFCRSLEMGVITMNNEIIGKVSARHDMKIEEEHIVSVIHGNETILPDDVKKTIIESAAGHTNKIIDKLRELLVDLRANPVIFVGGGSSLFTDYINNSPMVVKAEYLADPRANAVGYSMLAEAQIQKLAQNGEKNESA
jgi:plasmid segregation protein ParM